MSRVKSKIFSSLVAILSLGLTSNAHGSEFVIDQSFDPEEYLNVNYAIFSRQDISQTFKIGITGNLGKVDVFVESYKQFNDGLLFSIRRTIEGLPLPGDQHNLVDYSAQLPQSIEGTWHQFDFTSTPIRVRKSELLAIVLSSPNGEYSWSADPFGGYDRGESFARDPTESNVWGGDGREGGDQLFRTYVQRTGSPESAPGPIPIMGAPIAWSWSRKLRKRIKGILSVGDRMN